MQVKNETNEERAVQPTSTKKNVHIQKFCGLKFVTADKVKICFWIATSQYIAEVT